MQRASEQAVGCRRATELFALFPYQWAIYCKAFRKAFYDSRMKGSLYVIVFKICLSKQRRVLRLQQIEPHAVLKCDILVAF